MWRRLLLLHLALGSLLPVESWALSCTSHCGPVPCNFAFASSWSCAAVPTTADVCTIAAGDTVFIQDDRRGCGKTVINGTLAFDTNAGGRDPDGWRTFTFRAPVTGSAVRFGSAGRFVQGKNDRVAFDTTDQTALVDLGASGEWGAEGSVSPETTVTVVDRGTPTIAQCGQAVGRLYTITPAIGTSSAKQYRRIVFTSGRARTRHFVIASVPSGGSFNICTDELDEGACAGPGAPYSACTAAGVSKNKQRLTPHAPFTGTRVFPVSQHSAPVFSGSAEPTVVPSTGDTAVIVQDTQMFETGGTRGYRFFGPNTGSTRLPFFRAATFDFNASDAPMEAVFLSVSPSNPSLAAPGDYDYLNYHDYPASDGFALGGFTGVKVRWGAFHDAGNNAGESSGTIIAGSNSASPGCSTAPYCGSDGVEITDNIFYRTRGNAMQIGTSAIIAITTGARVNRNMFFDGCTTQTGECSGLELDSCQDCEVAHNIGWALCRGDGTGDAMLALGGGLSSNSGTSVHDNWLVNGCGVGINADGAGLDLGHQIGITHNYISHMKRHGGIGGRWYSNIVKNVGLNGSGLGAGLYNPIRASGNFIEGVDDAVAASVDCDLVGDSGCAGFGIRYGDLSGNQSGDPVGALDDVIVGIGNTSTYEGPGAIHADPSVDFPVTLGHQTLDNRGQAAPGVQFMMSRPVSPIVIMTAADIFSTHRGDADAVGCISQPGVEYSVGTIYSTLPATPSEGGGVVAPACGGGTLIRVADPGFTDRTGMDFSFRPGAVGETAGGSPPGSAIGSRAFRFDTDRLSRLWGGILTFDSDMPVDFANGDSSNIDQDGDGVMDMHDDCPFVFNPSQYDADDDGQGEDCQNIPQAANVDDNGSSQGRIDGSDLFVLAHAFGSRAGSAAFDPRVDLNPDGVVDGLDLALMASVWGRSLP